MEFEIKDSGLRVVSSSGLVRDAGSAAKTDYLLALDGPMFERWAKHLTKGANKYEPRNWMKARTVGDLEHARRSLGHHIFQYLRGDVDEDHAAAIFFNINMIEYIRGRSESLVQDWTKQSPRTAHQSAKGE